MVESYPPPCLYQCHSLYNHAPYHMPLLWCQPCQCSLDIVDEGQGRGVGDIQGLKGVVSVKGLWEKVLDGSLFGGCTEVVESVTAHSHTQVPDEVGRPIVLTKELEPYVLDGTADNILDRLCVEGQAERLCGFVVEHPAIGLDDVEVFVFGNRSHDTIG